MSNRAAIFTCEYPPYPGGIATYTREIARAALEIGHEPVVYVFVERGTLPDDGFEIVRLKPDVYSHARLPQLAVAAAKMLAKRDFDIALIGAGGLAIPIASRIKSMGKIGIDLGGHLQALFGVLGKRYRRWQWEAWNSNEWCIDMPAKYRPKEADEVCDSGAYW